MIQNTVPSGIGTAIEYKGAYVMNRTGATLTVGELVMCDKLAGDAGFGGGTSVINYCNVTNTGSEQFPLNNMLSPTTAGLGALGSPATMPSWFGIVDQLCPRGSETPGADDTMIHICMRGFTKGKMKSTVGAADTSPGEYGKPLFGENNVRTLNQVVVNGQRCFGWLLQENSVADTLAPIIFDGFGGFGGAGAAS